MAYNPYGEVKRETISRNIFNPPDKVVSFEQDDHPALSRNLLRDLQAERAKHLDGLIAAKDWPDFEKRRGEIRGIETAIALCQAADAKLRA